MEAFFEWEEQLLMFLQNSVRGPVLDTIMQFITSLGDGGFLAIAACLVLLLVPRWRKVGLTASLSLALDYVFLNLILKNIVARVRPYVLLEGLQLITREPSDYSFPSGHTFSSFAAATAISRSVKFYGRMAVFLLAFCIGFSRVYLFVHYPCDVIAGVVLGIIFGMISWKIFFYLRNLIYVVILSFLKRKFMKLGK